MMRIIVAAMIAKTSAMERLKTDIVSPLRCTTSGYTQVYEDITRAYLVKTLSERDRYELIMRIRNEMCGKVMYARYEYGVEGL